MNTFEDDFPKSRRKEAEEICRYFYVDIYCHPVCNASDDKREKCGRYSTEKGMAGFDFENIKEIIVYKCDKLKDLCDKTGHLPQKIALKYRYPINEKGIAAVTINTSDGEVTVNRKIGRNEPCPCGSGKKFKKCCVR